MSRIAAPKVTFDVHEIHIPANIIMWEFKGRTDSHFAWNPYGGGLTFRSPALNWVFNVGKAHSIECARKVVRHLCQKETLTAWLEPTPVQMDHGHQGTYETLTTPTWDEHCTYAVRTGRLTGRVFCHCGECPTPETFRFTKYPCSVWCTAYFVA